jgi:hypothetical protein
VNDGGRSAAGAAAADCGAAVAALASFYETLAPESLRRIGDFYAPDARFRDPFNDVVGVAAIERIFAHMFATVDAPRFRVTARFEQEREAMLGWDFHMRLRGHELVIRGVTHLRFDATGRVVLHRDYWDVASELYARLPLVGPLTRWLQRRFSAG